MSRRQTENPLEEGALRALEQDEKFADFLLVQPRGHFGEGCYRVSRRSERDTLERTLVKKHALSHAIAYRDVPMLQGTALALGLIFVGLNAITDMAVLAADPRRRA